MRRFGEVVEDRFDDKMMLQEEAARKLAEAIGLIARVVEGIEKSSTGLDKQIGRQLVASESFLQIYESRAIPQQDQFLTVAELMRGTIVSLNQRIKELDEAIAKAATRLDQATPKLEGTLELLHHSATDFGVAVNGFFDPAAKKHLAAIETWSTGASETLRLVGKLEEAAGSVAAAAPHYAQAGEDLRKAVDGQLVPAQVALKEGAEAVLATVQDLSRKFEAFGGIVDSSSPAFVRFAQLIDKELVPTAVALREFRGVAATLAAATEDLGKQIGRHDGDAARLDESYRALNDATERLTNSGESFRQALSDRVLPMQEALDRVLRQLDGTSQSLEKSLNDGLRSGPDYLQSFKQQLDRLQALAEGLGPLATAGPGAAEAVGGLSKNVERMAASIAELADRMDAVPTTPPSSTKKKWRP